MFSFRILCAVLACMSFASAAPQDSTGQPLATIDEPETASPPENTPVDLETGEEDTDITTPEAKEGKDLVTTPNELIAVVTENSPEKTPESPKPRKFQRKKPSPRFLSKLSYFKNSVDDSGLLNFIERAGNRKFRSRCRCEKITNCPKLQISVPRCPEEYFMCCF